MQNKNRLSTCVKYFRCFRVAKFSFANGMFVSSVNLIKQSTDYSWLTLSHLTWLAPVLCSWRRIGCFHAVFPACTFTSLAEIIWIEVHF